jgi:hypothetical protein
MELPKGLLGLFCLSFTGVEIAEIDLPYQLVAAGCHGIEMVV